MLLLRNMCRAHVFHISPERAPRMRVSVFQGNIRVFCRVRPLLASEDEHSDEHLNFADDGKTLEVARLADMALSEVISGGWC